MIDPHAHVGYDAPYLERLSKERKEPPPYDLVEPHHGREMTLMCMGLKPCAIIHQKQWTPLWQTMSVENKWCFKTDFHRGDVYVTLPHERWRIHALSVNREDAEKPAEWTDAHIETEGRLLGYTQEEVDAFIAILKLTQSEQRRYLRDRWNIKIDS
jgi:hypothetical protein